MATPPPGFRYVDIHTHLHPPWLWRAIRRWFQDKPGWEFRYPTEPEAVARILAEHDVERFVFFSYAHKPGLARELNAWLAETAAKLPAGLALGTRYPGDPDVLDVAREALDRHRFKGFKFHIDLALMPRCPHMYLDTTAAMYDASPMFRDGGGASPADVTDEDLVRWQDRVVFGSDFPNTPHPYDEERRPIWERPLPETVHRKIFRDNARRLLDL